MSKDEGQAKAQQQRDEAAQKASQRTNERQHAALRRGGSQDEQHAAGVHVEHKRSGVGDGYAPADPVSEHTRGTRGNMQPVTRDSVTGEIVQQGPDLRAGNYREASQRAAEQTDSRTGTQDGSGLEGGAPAGA